MFISDIYTLLLFFLQLQTYLIFLLTKACFRQKIKNI